MSILSPLRLNNVLEIDRKELRKIAEIKILAKIALLAYGIACLLFGLVFVFMGPQFIGTLVPGWETNALQPRVLGGFLVVIGFYDILIILYKGWDWENVKVAYMALFSFIIPMLIGQILVMALMPMTQAFINEMLFEVPLESILFILGLVGYLKQKP